MTPSRKRRLAKVAAAMERLEGALLILKLNCLRGDSYDEDILRAAQGDFSSLYYLSRLARKAPTP